LIFAGEFAERVDTEGRINVPAPFRPAFEDGLVLARGYERCIVAFTPAAWQRVGDGVSALSLTERKARRLARFTFSGARPAELDRQGRLSLPAELLRYADADRSVMVVGAGAVVEIWAADAWEAEREGLIEDASRLSAGP
jgi:MraZ protein